jgi:radical SAM protein with 4Fe4S-binding SPASM domain
MSDPKLDLNVEECKSVIDQLVDFNTKTLSLAGGEPLLGQHIWDTLEYAKGKFKRLVLSTNGTLITSDIAKKLAKHLTNVQVSVDGPDSESHDYVRGVGNFDKTMKAIHFLKDVGLLVDIRMTIYKETMSRIHEFIDLTKKLELSGAYMRRVISSGNAAPGGKITRLSSSELKQVLGDAIAYGKSIDMHVASADYFCQITFNNEARLKAENTQKLNGSVIGGCAVGVNSFYLMQNGTIAYCPYLPIYCGSLRENNLKYIWENSEMLKIARALRYNLKGKCGKCSYLYACGGCRAYAFAETGDILAEDSGCWL